MLVPKRWGAPRRWPRFQSQCASETGVILPVAISCSGSLFFLFIKIEAVSPNYCGHAAPSLLMNPSRHKSFEKWDLFRSPF